MVEIVAFIRDVLWEIVSPGIDHSQLIGKEMEPLSLSDEEWMGLIVLGSGGLWKIISLRARWN